MTDAVMDLGMSARVRPLAEKVRKIMREDVAPLSAEFHDEIAIGDRWEIGRAHV